MMNPNRIADILRPVLVVLGCIFILVLIWGWIVNDDDEDDEFTVTITYNCDRVITGRDYPNEVLSQCLDLRNDIKRRNN